MFTRVNRTFKKNVKRFFLYQIHNCNIFAQMKRQNCNCKTYSLQQCENMSIIPNFSESITGDPNVDIKLITFLSLDWNKVFFMRSCYFAIEIQLGQFWLNCVLHFRQITNKCGLFKGRQNNVKNKTVQLWSVCAFCSILFDTGLFKKNGNIIERKFSCELNMHNMHRQQEQTFTLAEPQTNIK